MKKYAIISGIFLILIVAVIFLFRKTNRLKNEISALESRHRVEFLREIDRIESLNFEIYKMELQKKDSIYNMQIKILQDENKRITAHYSRLYNDYSNIVVERPKW